MARVFSLMTCVMLFLAVEHGVQSPLRSSRKSSTEDGLRGVVATLIGAVKSLRRDQQRDEKNLKAVMSRTSDLGSIFVCWGQRQCPYRTKLVYSGVAGGKQYHHKGSGTNRLCLTRSPKYDDTPLSKTYGHLYGAEYQDITNHLDHNVPCAVCRAPYSTIIMMAATLKCPKGWRMLYDGHLSSTQATDQYATEYVCLDANPENIDNGKLKNENGLLFYYVISVCGSLPCPPYINRKILTCVVCAR